jgi:hypothetical protein
MRFYEKTKKVRIPQLVRNIAVSDRDDRHNLVYFAGSSVRELFELLEDWQQKYDKRFLSVSLQQERLFFCCIAVFDPR